MLTISTPSFAKKNIHIIATGGTIAGSSDSSTSSNYASGQVDISTIIKSIPDINTLANINAEQIFQVGSQDMNDELLLKLAQRVDDIISKYSTDAVVITHGTDTIEETAYFLNLVIKTKKPIILVGSMRPSTALSADGSLNLYNAVALAASRDAKGQGVLISMNDTIYNARNARKSHTTNVAAFVDDNAGKVGQVYFGDVDITTQTLKKHTHNSAFTVSKIKNLPKVDIIYAHSGFDSNVIDYYINSGSKAIILAGVGDGNADQKTINALAKAAEAGVYIIRSSRVFGGKIIRNSEINDDKLTFITANNLTPQKARILAKVALSNNVKDHQELQNIFDSY
ncbi:MAG: type II asparaginase [Rickettsiales bacterium]|nr:type II asparaginase [Rickettsiales bacterium]